MTFSALQLVDPLRRALEEEGYTSATPIQAQAIPHVLAGRDLLAVAQTGTGKTAAFALPILQLLAGRRPAGERRPVRALVLTPTRELAGQVSESFRTYGRHLPLRHAVAYGGVGIRPQADALRHGVDVLVATPGRLIDLLDQRLARLDGVEILVLDEADRMLDMGFLPAVRRIIAVLPRKRQNLFVSATMGPEPAALAARILVDPVRVEVTPPATTVETVAQSVHFVEKAGKQALLERLLQDANISRALVFTRTKRGADRVVRLLHHAGIHAGAIHANKSQGQRERALAAFREGHTRVLVATDIAARGIDVDDISHVVNYDLPNVPEAYVHRIGRTARAGAKGAAISLCDSSERPLLRDIEREIRMRVPVGGIVPAAGAPHAHARAPHAQAPTGTDRQPRAHEGARRGEAQQPGRVDRRPEHRSHGAERRPHAAERRPHGAEHRPQGADHRAHGAVPPPPNAARHPAPRGAAATPTWNRPAGRRRFRSGSAPRR
jgi:ATP-dependent RNA helicase RhlE